MKLKEKTISEINRLPPDELARVYDFIQFIKKGKMKERVSKEQAPYLRSRKILEKCKGSLADDVIGDREERL
jgi:hypothetical protein